MRLSNLFLYLLLTLLQTTVYAVIPSVEEVNSALGLDPSTVVTFDIEEGVQVEVTESGLEIEVPSGQEASVTIHDIPIPTSVQYSMMVRDGRETSVSFKQDESYIRTLSSDYFRTARWREYNYDLIRRNNSPTSNFTFTVPVTTHRNPTYETRTLLLKEFLLTPGITIELSAPEGFETTLSPIKERYDHGEPVTVSVTSTGAEYTFKGWKLAGWYSSPEDFDQEALSFTIFPESNLGLSVSGEITKSIPGGTITIDMGDTGFNLISTGDDPFHFSLEDNSKTPLQVQLEGPGVLRFDAIGKSHEISAWFSKLKKNTNFLPGQHYQYQLWLDSGYHDFDIEAWGNMEISNFSLSPQVPVEIEVIGSGSVDGLIDGAYVQDNTSVPLTAIPANGWFFESWQGDHDSSEPTIHIDPRYQKDFSVIFYKPISSDLFPFKGHDEHPWLVEPEDEGWIIRPDGPLPGSQGTTISWILEGPGLFRSSYFSDYSQISLRLNGELVSKKWDGSHYVFESSLPPGPNAFKLHYNNDGRNPIENPQGLRIDEWSTGLFVSISNTLGGRIEGIEKGQHFVPVNHLLKLTAVPEEGYTFSHWEGSHQSDESEIEYTVRTDSTLSAIFVQENDVPGQGARQAGHLAWHFGEDTWTLPAGLTPSEFAWVEQVFEGPASIRFEGNLSWVSILVNGEPTSLPYDRIIRLIEGENRIRLQAEGETPAGIDVGMQSVHWVDLGAIGADLTVNPPLEYDYQSERHSGYLPHGTNLEITPTSFHEDNVFIEWDGSLADQPETVSIILDRLHIGTAFFGVEKIIEDTLTWEVEGHCYYDKWGNNIRIPSVSEEKAPFILTSYITGPGLLVGDTRDVADLELFIDGEPVPSNFSGALYYTTIPEGNHTVKLAVTKTADWNYAEPSYSYSHLYEGWSIFKSGQGGTVNVSPRQPTYSNGEEVEISAVPTESNRFASWYPPFEDRGDSFSIDVTSHTEAVARFEALDSIDELNWEYQGRRPFFYPSNYDGKMFVYVLSKKDEGSTFEVSTSISGPASVTLNLPESNYPYRDNEQSEVKVAVAVSGQTVDTSEASTKVVLGPGDHLFTWTVQVESMGEFPAVQTVKVPHVERSFTVNVNAQNADIEWSEVKDQYEPGETVTLTAPEKNELGHKFIRWESNNEFISGDVAIQISVDQDHRLTAVYREPLLELDGLFITETRGGWDYDPDFVSPEATGALLKQQRTSYANLELWPKSAGNVSFDVFIGQKSSELTISVKGREDLVTPGGAGWTRFTIPCAPSHPIKIGHAGSQFTAQTYFSNFNFSDSASPTIIHAIPGGLTFEPSLANARHGDSITARPSSSFDNTFAGWINSEGQLVSQPSLQFVLDESFILRAAFNPEKQTLWGPTKTTPYGAWIEIVDRDKVKRFDSSYSAADLEFVPHTLIFEVTGPRVLRADTYKTGHPIQAYLDGKRLTALNSSSRSGKLQIQIPPGSANLTITHPVNPGSRASFTPTLSEPGYHAYTKSVEGGQLNYGQSNEVYQSGDSVPVSAPANSNYAFVGWTAPYENEENSFQVTAGDHSPLIPIFEIIERPNFEEFEFLYHTWEVRNATLTIGATLNRDTRSSFARANKQSYAPPMELSTDVEGPKVLHFRNFTKSLTYSLNGESRKAISVDESSETAFIQIPDGRHKLTLYSQEYSFTLDPNVSFIPGYLITLENIGTDATITPLKRIYRPGESITVSASPALPDEVFEWIGLEGYQANEANQITFAADNSLTIESRLWIPVRLFGYDFEKAGNGFWSSDGSGYSIPRSGSSSKQLLRTVNLDPGIYRTTFYEKSSVGSFTKSVDLVVFDGDQPWSRGLSSRQKEPTPVYLEKNSTDLVFEIGPLDSDHTDLHFSKFEHLPQSQTSPYLQWWNRFDRNRSTNQTWGDLSLDFDNDGFSNYEEFRMGTNPFHLDNFLQVSGLNAERNPLKIDVYSEKISDLENSSIQYSYSPYGPWLNAETTLESELSDKTGWTSYLFDLTSRVGGKLFIRISHEDSTPDISTLINP